MARFAPPDHLVFWRAGAVLAVPFDPKRRPRGRRACPCWRRRRAAIRRAGSRMPPSPRTGRSPTSPAERRSASGASSSRTEPARRGRFPCPLRSYHYPRFSPDGKRIAVTIGPGHGNADDVWICEIATGALSRLTFGDGNGNYYPVWSPDGKRVAFSSDRGHQGVYFKNADGSGEEEPLQPDARPQLPQDWSRDGSLLAINQGFPNSDVLTVSLPRPARNSHREGRRVSGLLAGRKMGGVRCADFGRCAADPRQAGRGNRREDPDHFRLRGVSRLDGPGDHLSLEQQEGRGGRGANQPCRSTPVRLASCSI